MKKTVIALITALVPIVSSAQPFTKYETMEDVDAMVMTSKMFKMLAKVDLSEGDGNTEEYMDMIENLDEIKMFSSAASHVRNQMAADAKLYLEDESLEQLMQINEEGKNINFYTRPSKNENFVNELFMFMEGEINEDLISIILRITGDIDLSQLSKLASTLQIPGAQELENLEIN